MTHTSTERLPFVIRALNVIENVGNKLPHPFWLFWILAAILAVTSALYAMAGAGVTDPESGEFAPVRSLLSGEGLAMAVETAPRPIRLSRPSSRSWWSSWAWHSPSAPACWKRR